MTTTKPQLLTADDLLRLHSEGVKGELIMTTGRFPCSIRRRCGCAMASVWSG